MADLNSLPADQRAALQLLLSQGQTYAQLADLLGIDPGAVRKRAHIGLARLGPESGARLDVDVRAQVCDYLLGQQTVSEREATRERLAGSPAARGWARAVAGDLRPLAGDALPEIPPADVEESEPVPARDDDDSEPPFARRPAPERDLSAFARGPATAQRRSSRLGGALLLGGLGVVLAVVIILVVTGGDDKKQDATGSLSTNPSQTSTQSGQPRAVAQINLLSPGGGTRIVGLAQVFKRGNQRAIIMAAQGVTPGAYALWLYNSPSDAKLLGFVPQRVGRNGKFATQGVLPADASRYRQLVVTSEVVRAGTTRPPARPGAIILRGALKLG